MSNYEANPNLNCKSRFVFKAPETPQRSSLTESVEKSSSLNESFASSESKDSTDQIVKVILQNGIEHASRVFGFRLNTYGIKRPDRRSRIGKEITTKLENLGYKFESN